MADTVDLDYLKNSICKTCAYRMSRTVVPFDYRNYDFSDDEIEEIQERNEEGYLTVVDEHFCLVLKDTMDYAITACNFYTPQSKGPKLIIGNTDIFGS